MNRVELSLAGLSIDTLLRLLDEWKITLSGWARDLSRLESLSVAEREGAVNLPRYHYDEMAHAREEYNFAFRQLRRVEERIK